MRINNLMEDAFHIESFITKEEISLIYESFGDNVIPEVRQNTGTIGYSGWGPETGTESLIALRKSLDEKIKKVCQQLYGLNLHQSSCLYKRMFVGDGHSLHIDNPFGQNLFNQYVALLMITEDYEGGTLRFPIRGVEVRPKAGDLVLFMGDERMAHEVDSVLSGTRDNVVMYYRNAELDVKTSIIALDYIWDDTAPYGVRPKKEGPDGEA